MKKLGDTSLNVYNACIRKNGQGQMVPGDGTFEENPHKIPRQIRERREIIGFIHSSFANEVLLSFFI